MDELDDFEKEGKRKDAEDDASHKIYYETEMEKAKKRSAADRVFFEAGHSALKSMQENELTAKRNKYGEFQFTVRQGLKAAAHGREDAAATLTIQHAILHRLDRNYKLLWVAILFLAYITFRLS
jgi:hypothetical protein